jgi:hypothetical protein
MHPIPAQEQYIRKEEKPSPRRSGKKREVIEFAVWKLEWCDWDFGAMAQERLLSLPPEIA